MNVGYARGLIVIKITRLFMRFVRYFLGKLDYKHPLYRISYALYIRWNAISRLRKKKVTEMEVQIHAACHCNLNCAACNAFCPIIEETFADTEVIKKDLARLALLTDGNIKMLVISGGEPLLNPKLPEIISCARSYFPNVNLQIITNGTLLTGAAVKFWESCRDNKAKISITLYPIKINIDKIKEIAEQYNVEVNYQDDTDIREKTMYCTPLDTSGGQDIKESYRLCFMANYCFTLENGRMYTCPVIAHMQHFNSSFNQKFTVSKRDSIDIHEVGSIDEVLSFMCKPMPFCRYCNKKDRINGIKWEVSKRDLSEWIF